jgi:hypothetical protein
MASRGKRQREAPVAHRWSKSQRHDAEGPAAGTPLALDADLSQLDSSALPFSATTQPEFTVSPYPWCEHAAVCG